MSDSKATVLARNTELNRRVNDLTDQIGWYERTMSAALPLVMALPSTVTKFMQVDTMPGEPGLMPDGKSIVVHTEFINLIVSPFADVNPTIQLVNISQPEHRLTVPVIAGKVPEEFVRPMLGFMVEVERMRNNEPLGVDPVDIPAFVADVAVTTV